MGELRVREAVVLAALQLIRPDDDDREVLRIVFVRIAVAAAIEQHRVVEQDPSPSDVASSLSRSTPASTCDAR